MTTSLTQGINLEDFLKLPYLEDSPAWEYLDGVAIQKPMPKTRHSILQKRLLAEVDSHTADYTALPELRCTFGGRSIVPDVAVIAWNRINLNEAGEPEDDFREAPLHCLKHGGKLGWMLDPDDYSVLMFTDQQEPEVCRGDHQLKVIAGVQLTLTPQQIFAWLKVGQARQSK
ncbi:MAG: Uma2 family endonuclease [Microcystis aeruginosa G13-03]|nr:Uma2 family endonuclease [Microcystis aeruginosa G13-03]